MDQDLIKLYSTRILALAADIPHLGRLTQPMGTARERSPQCGSTLTVDVDIADGRVIRFAQDVKACALGQAAAAVVGGAVIGRSLPELIQARDGLRAMLEGGEAPPPPFDGLAVLKAAQSFTNRHASILLSLNAAISAVQDAESKVA